MSNTHTQGQEAEEVTVTEQKEFIRHQKNQTLHTGIAVEADWLFY